MVKLVYLARRILSFVDIAPGAYDLLCPTRHNYLENTSKITMISFFFLYRR